MEFKEIETELRHRIGGDVTYFKGELPERHNIAWRAYLAGLLEWGTIDVATHQTLVELLPDVNDDPSAEILRGRD